ncbi:hypothetical protein [Frankia sp. AgW1.1]|uniref:hypothetical protein n=1 Tax=Frankia sp. AgW1.1 TaxID=1836971 RepID=UPI001934909C|nr:hypothetical protein [Frankia sp. AgW1.1]MBL7487114.1 hypothetical protein [Frankia sp. AgW1.1]
MSEDPADVEARRAAAWERNARGEPSLLRDLLPEVFGDVAIYAGRTAVTTPESRRAEREVAGTPPHDCGCYFLSGGSWHLQWGQHDGRCHVPLYERIEALEARVTELEQDGDDSGWCEACGEDYSNESHYHCSRCGKVCSVMGHLDPEVIGKFTCEPKESP